MPELELGEREDDAGKKPEEVQGGEGGGGGSGGGGGGGNSTQDDKGATQPTRELPELVPGAHDASNKDGKKPHCRVSEMVTVENQASCSSQRRLNDRNETCKSVQAEHILCCGEMKKKVALF